MTPARAPTLRDLQQRYIEHQLRVPPPTVDEMVQLNAVSMAALLAEAQVHADDTRAIRDAIDDLKANMLTADEVKRWREEDRNRSWLAETGRRLLWVLGLAAAAGAGVAGMRGLAYEWSIWAEHWRK